MSWNIKTPGDYINGPLTVAGNATLNGTLTVNGAGPHSVAGQLATTGGTAGFQMQPRDGSGANWLLYNPTGDEFRIYNNIGGDVVIVNNIGNIGIGVAPSAWRSAFRAVDLGARSAIASNADSVSTDIFHNLYVDAGGAAIHKALGAGAFLRLEGNVYKFLAASSAAAGASASLTTPLLINANAAIVLKDGNAAANGIGIAFPAAQSASTDANTLDDYEEGTWTPTVAASSGTPTTVTIGTCKYTKIGRQVICTFDFTVVDKGTASGSFIFSLPFTSDNLINCGAFRENGSVGNMGQVFRNSAGDAAMFLYHNVTVWVNTYRMMGTYTYCV